MPDYTNSNLTSYVATLIDTYSRFGWTITAAVRFRLAGVYLHRR